VGIAFAETGVLGRVKAGIHARQDGEVPSRREGEISLRSERVGVGRVGSEDFLENG